MCNLHKPIIVLSYLSQGTSDESGADLLDKRTEGRELFASINNFLDIAEYLLSLHSSLVSFGLLCQIFVWLTVNQSV